MSTILEDEPLVVAMDERVQCGIIYCDRPATWSTIWSCGETISYCDDHLAQMRRESAAGGVHCTCIPDARTIHVVVIAPL